MTADDTLDEPFMSVMVAARPVAVTLACGKKQCQVSGVACVQKTALNCPGERLRTAADQKSACCNRITVLDHQGGFFC